MALFKNFYKNNQNLLNNRFLILCFIAAPFLFRQSFYGALIQYKLGTERLVDTRIDAALERHILTHPDVFDRKMDDVDKIIHTSLKITADVLKFNGDAVFKTTPLSIWRTGETNSEGMAAFFNTVCTYLLRRYRMSDQYSCRQYIAERMRGGMNLEDAMQSPYSGKSPFNKNRDIVAIVDVQTGQTQYIDPSIYVQANIVTINVLGTSNGSGDRSAAAKVTRSRRWFLGSP